MDYKDDISIDKYNLDEEVVHQLDKFVCWAEAHVEAMDVRDKAKTNFELVKAKLDMDIRSNPSDYGLLKVTEGSIQSALIQDGDYQEALGDYQGTRKDAEIMAIAREAMLQRKSLLENLIKLQLSAYYGDPEVRENEIRKDIRKKQTK